MLTVTPAQMEPFGRRDRERFVARMTKLLAESDQAADRAAIAQQVDRLIDEAAGYGLIMEQHVATFIVAAWTLGIGFVHDYPPVRETLESPDLTPQAKTLWLREWTEGLFDRLKETLP